MANIFVGDLNLMQSAPGRWRAEGRSLYGVVYGVIGGGSLLTIFVVVGSGALKAKDMQTGWPFLLLGLIASVGMMLMMLRSPIRQIIDVDRGVSAVVLTQIGLLGGSVEARTRRDTRSLRDVVLVLREAALNRRVISVGFADGSRWVLSFKNVASEVDPLADFLRGEARRLREPHVVPESGIADPEGPESTAPVAGVDHAVTDLMLRQVRSAAYWSLGLGALHLIVPGLSKPWGVTLAAVGALSLLLPTPAMQVVNVITILWVAVLNMLSGSPIWGAVAATQIWNGIQGFRRWRMVEQQRQLIEGASTRDVRESQARRILPWAGLGLGLIATFGVIGVFVSAVIYGAFYGSNDGSFLAILSFVESLVVNLGVVGFAVSLAALLAGFRPKPVAVVGLLSGVAAVALEFGLVLLFSGS